jgi:type IV secretory pathway VirB2 component (pilin)
MEKINWRRVFLGGMIAGVVLMVLAGVATAIFTSQQKLRDVLQTIRPSSDGSTALLFAVFAFLFLGILMTASYAAIRPRFGSGPKTAALAGFLRRRP